MICYFTEDIVFNFRRKAVNKRWLALVADREGRSLGSLNIIFCSDNYILEINQNYLNHDYFTDIITFDYCEGNILSGDLFISVDSVRDNAVFYGASDFDEELDRVIVHGILHLAGYDDHSPEDQKTMREKENYYLSLRASVTGTVPAKKK